MLPYCQPSTPDHNIYSRMCLYHTLFFFQPMSYLVMDYKTSRFYRSLHPTWEPFIWKDPSLLRGVFLLCAGTFLCACLHQDRGHRAAWFKVQDWAKLPGLRIPSLPLRAKSYSLSVSLHPYVQNVNHSYPWDYFED